MSKWKFKGKLKDFTKMMRVAILAYGRDITVAEFIAIQSGAKKSDTTVVWKY